LATGTNFSALHFDFLMGVSIIAKIVRETCEVLWIILRPRELVVPTTEEWLHISEEFYSQTQFPNCVGAVDGNTITHPIRMSPKKWYFIVYTTTTSIFSP